MFICFQRCFSELGGEHFDSEKEIENTATKMAVNHFDPKEKIDKIGATIVQQEESFRMAGPE